MSGGFPRVLGASAPQIINPFRIRNGFFYALNMHFVFYWIKFKSFGMQKKKPLQI